MLACGAQQPPHGEFNSPAHIKGLQIVRVLDAPVQANHNVIRRMERLRGRWPPHEDAVISKFPSSPFAPFFETGSDQNLFLAALKTILYATRCTQGPPEDFFGPVEYREKVPIKRLGLDRYDSAMAQLESLIDANTKVKVSSTLDKSVGKRHLIDANPETCWTSQQGLPQSVQIQFSAPVVPRRISLTFQGGFVGTRCAIYVLHTATPTRSLTTEEEAKIWQLLAVIHPEDVNRRQIFDLPSPLSSPSSPGTGITTSAPAVAGGVSAMRLIFEESSDFFGRITIYDLKIEGERSELAQRENLLD